MFFEGNFVDDIIEGKGKLYNEFNKLIYEGDFEKGEIKGKGALLSKDNNSNLSYKGRFGNNKPNGEGKLLNEKNQVIINQDFISEDDPFLLKVVKFGIVGIGGLGLLGKKIFDGK